MIQPTRPLSPPTEELLNAFKVWLKPRMPLRSALDQGSAVRRALSLVTDPSNQQELDLLWQSEDLTDNFRRQLPRAWERFSIFLATRGIVAAKLDSGGVREADPNVTPRFAFTPPSLPGFSSVAHLPYGPERDAFFYPRPDLPHLRPPHKFMDRLNTPPPGYGYLSRYITDNIISQMPQLPRPPLPAAGSPEAQELERRDSRLHPIYHGCGWASATDLTFANPLQAMKSLVPQWCFGKYPLRCTGCLPCGDQLQAEELAKWKAEGEIGPRPVIASAVESYLCLPWVDYQPRVWPEAEATLQSEIEGVRRVRRSATAILPRAIAWALSRLRRESSVPGWEAVVFHGGSGKKPRGRPSKSTNAEGWKRWDDLGVPGLTWGNRAGVGGGVVFRTGIGTPGDYSTADGEALKALASWAGWTEDELSDEKKSGAPLIPSHPRSYWPASTACLRATVEFWKQ